MHGLGRIGAAALFVAAAALACGRARAADDVASLKAELADMKTKMASMESRLAGEDEGGESAAQGDAATLTSMKKKGGVQIGGDVNVDILVKQRDDSTSSSDNVNSTEFHTESANLRFKISSGPDSYLYIKLDLDDAWDDDRLDNTGDQDDLLEECKYVWEHIRGSNWGMIFGKGEVPYGQDKTLGIIQSYHHNDQNDTSEGPVFIVNRTEARQTYTGLVTLNGRTYFVSNYPIDDNNPHNNVGPSLSKPGEVDNVFMISPNFSWKNVVKAEFTVFQNNATLGQGAMTRGMHEDRSDDSLLLQSYAARLWWLPTDGLTLEASFINMHCDSFGDRHLMRSLGVTDWERSVADQYALSLGFDYKAKTVPLEVFGEYEHGWDWNYTHGYYTNTYQLGFLWGLTSNVDLGMMAEYLDINTEVPGGDENTAYTKYVLSLQYHFQNGMYSIFEYGYEYMDASAGSGGDDSRDGQIFAFRTGWQF